MKCCILFSTKHHLFPRPKFDCANNRIPYDPIDPDYPCFYNTDLRSDTLAGFSILTLTATDAEQGRCQEVLRYTL